MTRPTLEDVAREAGVHKGTASRALNPALVGRVTERTATKVREAADRLGYTPDPLGRSLRTGRTRTIGVLVPDLSNPIFPGLVRGIEDQLRSQGYEAIIANTDNDRSRQQRLTDGLLARSCDGFIIATAFIDDSTVTRLAADRTPLVLVNRLVEGLAVPAVVSDDAEGMATAVRHLVQRGHTSLACLAGPRDLSITAVRVTAFLAELRRSGIAQPTPRVAYGTAYTIEGGREAARDVLEHSTGDVTAIVAGNDMMAVGCLAELAERGLRCPEDVSLVGFNDMPMAAYLKPALTTIAMPQYELGVEAAKLLVHRLADPTAPPSTTVLPTQLVERASVDARSRD